MEEPVSYPVTAQPEIKKPAARPAACPYPFERMTEVGHGFIVPVAEKKKFDEVRSYSSRYAKKHGIVITCLLTTDGSLQVRRAANVRPPERPRQPLTRDVQHDNAMRVGLPVESALSVDDAPTRDQFKTHLSHFIVGQTQLIAARYASFFDPMRAWIDELKDETGKMFYCIAGPDNTLQVGLRPATGSFFSGVDTAPPDDSESNAE